MGGGEEQETGELAAPLQAATRHSSALHSLARGPASALFLVLLPHGFMEVPPVPGHTLQWPFSCVPRAPAGAWDKGKQRGKGLGNARQQFS